MKESRLCLFRSIFVRMRINDIRSNAPDQAISLMTNVKSGGFLSLLNKENSENAFRFFPCIFVARILVLGLDFDRFHRVIVLDCSFLRRATVY